MREDKQPTQPIKLTPSAIAEFDGCWLMELFLFVLLPSSWMVVGYGLRPSCSVSIPFQTIQLFSISASSLWFHCCWREEVVDCLLVHSFIKGRERRVDVGWAGQQTYNPLPRNMKEWNSFNEAGSEAISLINSISLPQQNKLNLFCFVNQWSLLSWLME